MREEKEGRRKRGERSEDEGGERSEDEGGERREEEGERRETRRKVGRFNDYHSTERKLQSKFSAYWLT